jgi:replicative DNA helicase
LPQYDSESEELLLASLIQNGISALLSIEPFDIRDSDFFSEENGGLFDVLKQYIEVHTPDSVATSSIKLQAKQLNLEVNPDYVDSLSNIVLSSKDVDSCARIVKSCSLMRQCVARTSKLLNSSKELQPNSKYEDIIQLYDSAQHDFSEILFNIKASEFQHIYSGLQDLLNDIVIGKKKVGIVAQKFPKLMSAWGGSIRRGSLNIVSGKYKQGKSSLCLAITEDIATQGIPTVYIDTEMGRGYQGMRLLAQRTKVPLKRIEYGSWINDPSDQKKVEQELQSYLKFPFDYLCVSGHELMQIIYTIKKWMFSRVSRDENGNLKDCLIAVDYLKITSDKDYRSGVAEWQLVYEIATKLHDLAQTLNIPILLAIQLNEEGQAAQSKRIDWVCSNRVIIQDKTIEERKVEPSNKKLTCPFSRFEEPMQYGEFINAQMSYNDGTWIEGPLYSEVIGEYMENKKMEAKK